MVSSPFFLKIRAIAFSLILFISLLWIVLLSVYLYFEWDTTDAAERPIIAVMLVTNTLTMIMLLILLILPFRPWLDAARFLSLLLAHIGIAGAFAFWNPQFHCPTTTPDAEGVCRLLNLYILVASWVIPVLLVIYAAGLTLAMVRSSRRQNVLPPTDRESILPMMRPYGDSRVLSYSFRAEKATMSDRGSASDDKRKHISGVSSRTSGSLTKPPPAFFVSPDVLKFDRRDCMTQNAREAASCIPWPLTTHDLHMAGARWDPTSVKALLRLTSQRLGQLQEKKDSKASITRRDIATLLQQNNVGLARAKAQNLIQEDVSGDLLEILEMHVGVILEHFAEIDQQYVNSPVVVEAASSIIFAGAQADSKELQAVRELLIQRLGGDFARSAVSNRDNHVSPRVVHALSAPSPTAANLDMYLLNIAKTYGVQWYPKRTSLNSLSEILDPEASLAVDMPRLRQLCSRGIPDEPAWLRARVWKLFFGTLPVLKSTWSRDAQQQRDSYYDLVRRLLKPFSDLPPPTTSLAPLDASLFTVSKQLSRIPFGLFSGLNDEPENTGLCPLDDNAPDEIKISYANNLDLRLKAIQDRDSNGSPAAIPEIRLQSDSTPEISVSAPESLSSRRQATAPKTLVTSKPYVSGEAHPKHLSALFRLLYLHSVINPGNLSPHIPALILPLYSVLSQEIEPEDVPHVEADTFWLFEAMIGEFAELEDEEGGKLWMQKLGDRLTWADSELAETLHVKGLDPALPHYSYRWLAPLLTQTLPYSSVLVIWDALFSCSMRERDKTPKLEYLLDICTAMLIRARAALFRLGKSGRKSPSLWSEENTSMPPPSPLRAWEFGDAFVEGMSLLQLYPIEAAGGIDRLLQTASDLALRRQEEGKIKQTDNLTLGARLKSTMWKGFTNQMPSPDISPPESEDQEDDDHNDETDEIPESEPSSGLTARLASTVWRGITNKTSMEPPPSPLTPISPMPPASPIRSPWPSSKEEEQESQPEAPVTATIWNYAEKLKDSDAAAAFSKVSSNWRAKALGSWGARGPTSPQSAATPVIKDPIEAEYVRRTEEGRHASLPTMTRPEFYSPPSRPAFFRPPRDSVIGPSPVVSSPPASPPWSPQSEGGFLNRTRNLQDSFAALTRTQAPPPASKAGPRPLLLSSSTLITATPRSRPESISDAGQLAEGQWQHVPRGKGHNLQRDSQSSASSLSPLDAVGRLNPDVNIPSRRVALNRRSVSPMAPISRVRPTSESSSGTPDGGLLSPSLSSRPRSLQNTPEMGTSGTNGTTSARETNVLGLSIRSEETTDSEAPSISPRLRSKRYPSRPANIRTEDLSRPKTVADQQPSPQSLSVDWPEEAHDTTVTTPKAATFDDAPQAGRRRSSADQPRKMSGDGQEPRIRKVSGGSRARKSSTGTIKAAGRRNRESAAEEGDDEGGYDELLSAYESEDGSLR
ncbi:regulator of Vps4 activity in the MVB pathway-domain-containing protein [Mycena crocata]|nr:regulator of Vps4 activity in the MVB pathway-domain-containing protein [Mycena crocata]